jgi:hypothetical protein
MKLSTYPAKCSECYTTTEHDILTDACEDCGTVLETTTMEDEETENPILKFIRSLPKEDNWHQLHKCPVCKECVNETVHVHPGYLLCVKCIGEGKITTLNRTNVTAQGCATKSHLEASKEAQQKYLAKPMTIEQLLEEAKKGTQQLFTSREGFLLSLESEESEDGEPYPYCTECGNCLSSRNFLNIELVNGDVICGDCFVFNGAIVYTISCEIGCDSEEHDYARRKTDKNAEELRQLCKLPRTA